MASIKKTYDKYGIRNDILSPTGTINKLQRMRILINRDTSGKVLNKGNEHPEADPNPRSKTTVTTRQQRDLEQSKKNMRTKVARKLQPQTKPKVFNEIIIINPNVSPPISLVIQGKPSILEMGVESTWASVKSMGLNNPFQIFTGSEDTISFEISWYAKASNREDVINKCRLLESWTKADGYKSSPPTLYISWGSSKMFDKDSFILVSAPYRLSNFQNSYRKGLRSDPNSEIVDLGLLPNCATQSLTFKRVTKNNLTHEEIIPSSKLKGTSGVK